MIIGNMVVVYDDGGDNDNDDGTVAMVVRGCVGFVMGLACAQQQQHTTTATTTTTTTTALLLLLLLLQKVGWNLLKFGGGNGPSFRVGLSRLTVAFLLLL